ncbi:nucleoside phosphorylase domain-containing protein [Aspergillus karnatakaensis]|uniref:nucleoside phosphorylase domain-containing protein n=1 Tax=Aspergillus karnatakaensis TaxID=1810916 RepID=UPI003CCCD562
MDLDFPPSGNTRVPAARKPRREEYHVGIICALAIEHAAVVGMLDEAYPTLSTVHGDDNHYAFGRIGLHNVVVACLPAGVTGTVSATRVASNMQRTFRDIKVGLMVGIGGGVPSTQRDIRLGDVVVSQPEGAHGGVVQWDFGRTEAGGCFRRTRTLNKPPAGLLHALQAIQSRTFTDGIDLNECLSFMAGAKPLLMDRCRYPGAENDCLFVASYEHVPGSTCEGCDKTQVVHRQTRPSTSPCVHYGNIASGNQVMKDAVTRDRIGDRENIICFEMEAAGLMDDFPCLVIRGICDYADSHKNDEWQPYAAAAAAAFARMLLRDFIQPSGVSQSACT